MKCPFCKNEAKHQLGYSSLTKDTEWTGTYCTVCFITKLREMGKAWMEIEAEERVENENRNQA